MAQKVRILCDEVDEDNNYILRAGEIGILRDPATYTEAERQELAQFAGQDMRLVYVPRLNTTEMFTLEELEFVAEQEAMQPSATSHCPASKDTYEVGDVVELMQDSGNVFVKETLGMDMKISEAEWMAADEADYDDEDDCDEADYEAAYELIGDVDVDDNEPIHGPEDERRALKGYHALVYAKDDSSDCLCVRILENGCYGSLEKAIVRPVSKMPIATKASLLTVGSKVRVRWGKTDRFDRVIYPPGAVGVVIDMDGDRQGFGTCEVLVSEGEESTLFVDQFKVIGKYELELITEEEYARLAKPRLQVGDRIRVKDEPEEYLLALKEGRAASYDGPRKGDMGEIVEVSNEYPFSFLEVLDRYKDWYEDEDGDEDAVPPSVPGYLLEKVGSAASPAAKTAANPGCLVMIAMLLCIMALGVLL